jgi:hypothetical protein
MDALVRAVSGNEISPHLGHSTAFPLPVHPAGWVYWQIPYALYEDGVFVRQLEFTELWPRARELGAEVINLAHPLSFNAWFEYLGFDPPDVIPRLDSLPPDKFSLDFDTIELLTMNDVDVMLDRVLPVWSAMNDQGVFKTAVGVSDAHQRDAEAGFGRTLVAASTDAPKRLDLDEVWANLRARRAMVGGGIFVRVEIEGATPGDLVTASPPLDVHVHVEAADWVPVAEISVIANGETVATLVPEPPGQLDPDHPAVRFDGTVTVEPAVDTWYAVLAAGAPGDRLDPVFRGCRPVGLTNAVQVDVDGDGSFDPPDP